MSLFVWSRPRTAGQMAELLVGTLDLLAFVALFSTGEIRLWVFAFATLLAILLRATAIRLPDQVMVGLLFGIILGAFALGIKLRMHPVLVAAHAAPLFHACLWLAGNGVRFRSWRIGIGFVGLVLASALTPEFHIFALIILFIVICSLAVSSVFLDSTLRQRAPLLAMRPLPKGFVAYSVGLSLIIFLTSLVIFPLLPRAQLGTSLGFGRSDIGYKEEVNISDWARFREGGADHIVLRIFLPESLRGLPGLPFTLLRGKVLENFSGNDWSSAIKTVEANIQGFDQSSKDTFEIISEPLASSVLLVPYGAQQLHPTSIFSQVRRMTSGEWTKPAINNKREHYRFLWNALPKNFFGKNDLPRAVHTRVREYKARVQVEALAQSLGQGQKSDLARIRSVTTFFEKNKFSGSLEAEGSGDQDPLETFLFTTKKGHCELFASATALLLRSMGIPTRVVVGFRLSRDPAGAVIVVSNRDAHAWVEAHTREAGWVVVDTTPGTVTSHFLALEWFRSGYDNLSSYWYRYILSFDAETQFDLKRTFSQNINFNSRGSVPDFFGTGWVRSASILGLILVSVTLISWVLFRIVQIFWFGPSGNSVNVRAQKLAKERVRFEKIMARYSKQAVRNFQLEEITREWTRCYEKHRFGPIFIEPHAKEELTVIRKRAKEALGQDHLQT
jgi:transglutaminase-like putative cysteine protease